MRKLLIGLSVITLAVLGSSVKAFEIDGTTTTSISVNSKQKSKEVVVMKINLSPKERKQLQDALLVSDNAFASSEIENSKLPKSIDVGMNGTPVLDQGRHGSCVTFAVTAAVDALLGQGDYISQLCQLELGNYLSTYGSLPSGWKGSSGDTVLHQMTQFGIVSKQQQKEQSCAGVNEYPLADMNNTGSAMALDEYKQKGESLHGRIAYDPILTQIQFWSSGSKLSRINAVKKALVSNSELPIRVVIGALLDLNVGHAGLSASYRANQDTWALTDKIKNDPDFKLGGHELVVIGYDDNAVVVDEDGKKHQGVFTLRNSWGEDAGDHGNFYMTYDYFKHFAHEINQVFRVDN